MLGRCASIRFALPMRETLSFAGPKLLRSCGGVNYFEDGKVDTDSVDVRFFHGTFRQLEKIDLLHHFVGVNWPGAAAFLAILVDDSLQLSFFSVIKHTSNNKPFLTHPAH